MGQLDGKIALITGAARGAGKMHSIRLAEEGADIIAVDLCEGVGSAGTPGSTPDDLKDTVAAVEGLGRRIVPAAADIRDLPRMIEVAKEGSAELGGLDIVCANAAIWPLQEVEPTDMAERAAIWKDVIDINLTGTWNTLEATVPILLEAGKGGAITITGSTAGLNSLSIGALGQNAYTASKHGLVGLMRNYAVDLAPHFIRVNYVAPGGIATPMVENEVVARYVGGHPELAEAMKYPIPIPAVEPVDVSNAILYLVSDAGRYVTGVTLPVDAGFLLK
jgi:SDR family mycofactocin-dependent oxidoreductase